MEDDGSSAVVGVRGAGETVLPEEVERAGDFGGGTGALSSPVGRVSTWAEVLITGVPTRDPEGGGGGREVGRDVDAAGIRSTTGGVETLLEPSSFRSLMEDAADFMIGDPVLSGVMTRGLGGGGGDLLGGTKNKSCCSCAVVGVGGESSAAADDLMKG